MDIKGSVRAGDTNEGSRKKKKTAQDSYPNFKETVFHLVLSTYFFPANISTYTGM